MAKVLITLGTRPEAIKLAPVILELEARPERFEPVVCATAQHREMLDQVLEIFGIVPALDLHLMREEQTLPELTARAMPALSRALARVGPDMVLVQGDTTSAMAAALAAFYQKIPVGHVEAGLRTGSRYAPFPEEINRRLISVLATLHFAPTATAAEALRREGIDPSVIHVTGNTVVDALLMIKRREAASRDRRAGPRLVVVTAHRRESFGQGLEEICNALRELAVVFPHVRFVYPVHRNPNVWKPVHRLLGDLANVELTEPVDYLAFVRLMLDAQLILTDSGGIQEEAPALGVPVLVMREVTERPEAVETGVARLVGMNREAIVREASRLLADEGLRRAMAGNGTSPFGDGRAASRIVDILEDYLEDLLR